MLVFAVSSSVCFRQTPQGCILGRSAKRRKETYMNSINQVRHCASDTEVSCTSVTASRLDECDLELAWEAVFSTYCLNCITAGGSIIQKASE